MSTDNPRPDLTPQQRASLERGLAQSAAGEVYDLGSFAEYADTPTPERVTLTDEERNALAERIWTASRNDEGTISYIGANFVAASLSSAIGLIIAAREQALREEIAGECRHANVETFRSYPPHSKCLDCGQRVEQRWATQGGAR